MDKNKLPIRNKSVKLRKEFDGWAVLFDPNSNQAFGLEPVSVFIWNHLDGKHNEELILKKLKNHCRNVPENAEKKIRNFISQLIKKGLANYKS